MNTRSLNLMGHFQHFWKYLKKTRLLWIGVAFIVTLLALLLPHLSSVPGVTQNTALPSSTPPPFYTGGLEKGSGGQTLAGGSSGGYDHNSLFAPSPASTITGGLLTLESYPSPQVCARCHVGIHNNWQHSMHAVSAIDPWYLKVKEQLEFERPQAEVRECAGCHAPIALMTGEVGLYSTESASSKQGVSCFFCHSVEQVKSGNGGYVSNPGRIHSYAGGNYLSETAIEAAEHLVMVSPEVHKADMLAPWLRGNSGSKLCQSCHEFVKNGVKLQSTYSEWLASSYAKEGVSCQGCHFSPGAGETVESGNLVEHYPARAKVLRHILGGGSTVNSPRAEDNQAILKEAVKLRVTRAGNQLQVFVTNAKAGHSMPSGVTDLRQMWLEVTAKDASGKAVYSSGALDLGGQQPKNTVMFHAVFGDARGKPLVSHDIWRVAKLLEDTRIKANETRVVPYVLPNNARGVTVRLLWRDAPADFASWVLKQNAMDLPVLELARTVL
jgi:hypothetical protein